MSDKVPAADARELAVTILQLAHTVTARNGDIVHPADEAVALIESFADTRIEVALSGAADRAREAWCSYCEQYGLCDRVNDPCVYVATARAAIMGGKRGM